MPNATPDPNDPPDPAPSAARASSGSYKMGEKLVEWASKLLTLLVIPLIGWGIKLEINLAVKDQQIVTQQRDLTQLKTDHQVKLDRLDKELDKARTTQEAIQAAFNANTVALARLEEKLNAANHNLADILDRLRK